MDWIDFRILDLFAAGRAGTPTAACDNKYEQYITVDGSSKATVFNWNVEKTLLRIPTWD